MAVVLQPISMITKSNLHEIKVKLAAQHHVPVRDIIIDSLDSIEFDYAGSTYLAKVGNDEREGFQNYHNSVFFLNLTRANKEVVFDTELNKYFVENIADRIPAVNQECIIAVEAPYFRYWYSDDADWKYYYDNMPEGEGPHFLTPEELIKLNKAVIVCCEE